MKLKFIWLLIFPLTLFGAFSNFLLPNLAFKPKVYVDKNENIIAKISLADKIHIYQDSIILKLKDSKNLKISKIIKPQPSVYDGDKVYKGTVTFKVELQPTKQTNKKENIKFIFGYQGCSEAGLCYEPMSKTYDLVIDTSKLRKISPVTNQQIQKQKDISNNEDAIASTLKNGNIFIILGTFFGFGLLLALTPCVFPMIPIISGLIVSQGKNITTKKAFLLSITYVISMAFAYTIAGVIAGLFGSNLQASLQNPYVVVSFSLIFVALALSMFGFYELKLPDKLVSKISSKNQANGGFIGVAVMGFLSALIVGPCVAAPLAGALVYIGQTGDALLGGSALFVMSLGMGLPLILIGTGAGKFMPRPGEWMTLVNGIFGIIMLGVAIWMLEKIISASFSMFLWAVLAISSSLYLGVFTKEIHILRKTLSIFLFIYGTALFIGFLGGSQNIKEPLKIYASSKTAHYKDTKTNELNFHTVTNLNQLNTLLKKYKDKTILLDFSAKWCVACKELEETTFKDKRVIKALENYFLIRADLTQNNKEQKELSKRYKVFGPPVIIFIKNQKVLKQNTIVGYIDADKFLKKLP